MDKKTKKIALILTLAVVLIAAFFVIIEKTTSFELRLKKEMDYEEILLRIDEYALVRIDADTAAFVCYPGFTRHGGQPHDFSVYIEFDLNTHSAEYEWCVSRNAGVLRNEFAENARREHYAYSNFFDVRRGLPTYNFYMGISDVEPGYEIIGDYTEQLQYVELNGLYYFVFLEDYYF